MNILNLIQQSIEEVTETPLKNSAENKKLFCGLAKKHDTVNNSEIADYLNIAQSNISYYVKQHTLLSKNISYRMKLLKIEKNLLNCCAEHIKQYSEHSN